MLLVECADWLLLLVSYQLFLPIVGAKGAGWESFSIVEVRP